MNVYQHLSVVLLCFLIGCSTPAPITKLERDPSAETGASGDVVVAQGNGAWCWFGDPRVLETAKATYVSSITSDGWVRVEQINRDGTRKQKVLSPKLSSNDHNNPSIIELKDGQILVFFSQHNGGEVFIAKTTIPGEVDSFGKVTAYNAASWNGMGFTYPNLVTRMNGDQEQLLMFWRGDDWAPKMILSNDGGESFKGMVTLIRTEQRPYAKYHADEKGRVHMVFTNGHPSVNPNNSIYYMYLEGEVFKKANGEIIGEVKDLPFSLGRLDKIYGPKTFPEQPFKRAWIWDITTNSDGEPVAVFTATGADLNHDYLYARWTGSDWSVNLITTGGGTIQNVENREDAEEPYYAGGVFLDQRDARRIYLSSERTPGHHVIEEWKLKDNKTTFKRLRTISSEMGNAFRPVVPRTRNDFSGDRMFDVFWLEGRYDYYTEYQTSVMGLLSKSGVAIEPEQKFAKPHAETPVKPLVSKAKSEPVQDMPVAPPPRKVYPAIIAKKPLKFSDPEFNQFHDHDRSDVRNGKMIAYWLKMNRKFISDTWEEITAYSESRLISRASSEDVPIISFLNNRVDINEDGSLIIRNAKIFTVKCADVECEKWRAEDRRTANIRFDQSETLLPIIGE